MKKTPKKLVLRIETVRTLANMDLARAVGGYNTGAKQCPAILDTGLINCTTAVPDITTAACG